jgi:hypothetical protein
VTSADIRRPWLRGPVCPCTPGCFQFRHKVLEPPSELARLFGFEDVLGSLKYSNCIRNGPDERIQPRAVHQAAHILLSGEPSNRLGNILKPGKTQDDIVQRNIDEVLHGPGILEVHCSLVGTQNPDGPGTPARPQGVPGIVPRSHQHRIRAAYRYIAWPLRNPLPTKRLENSRSGSYTLPRFTGCPAPLVSAQAQP